jgi:hypothetical protein
VAPRVQGPLGGMHPSRAGLGLLPIVGAVPEPGVLLCVGAVPELGVLQACSAEIEVVALPKETQGSLGRASESSRSQCAILRMSWQQGRASEYRRDRSCRHAAVDTVSATGACVRVEWLAGSDAEDVVAAGVCTRVPSVAEFQPVAPLLETLRPLGPASESGGLQGAVPRR